ncbi:hypothetical protein JXA32_08755 [Candidatus Sumerlaeota bacterium]|nr:hypothetical protein [Candidatus Sumerlaeota bacterium]
MRSSYRFHYVFLCIVCLNAVSLWCKPDLIVTDIWDSQGIAAYQIQNQGDAFTTQTFRMQMQVDAVNFVSVDLQLGLNAKERYNGVFPQTPSSPNPTFNVTVIADSLFAIAEEDENNNSRTEVWLEDVIAPLFQQEPYANNVDNNSAHILFTTYENVYARVLYGREAGVLTESYDHPQQSMSFDALLTGLEPGSMYHYIVAITDDAGNATTSSMQFFLTQPDSDDSEAPTEASVTAQPREIGRQKVAFIGAAKDNIGVDRVEFWMNSQFLGVDYSAPYKMEVSLHRFASGANSMEIRAFDSAGNFTTGDSIFDYLDDLINPQITLNFSFPLTCSYTIDMPLSLHDESGGLDNVAFYVDGALRDEADLFRVIYIEDREEFYPGDANHTFHWNTLAETNGSHTVRFEATDAWGNVGSYEETVTVNNAVLERPQFDLVENYTEWNGYYHCVRTELNFENVGLEDADSFRLDDYFLEGFQAFDAYCFVSGAGGDDPDPTIIFDYDDDGSIVSINPNYTSYPAGCTINIIIRSMPLLTAPTLVAPSMGEEGTVTYGGEWRQGVLSERDEWELDLPPATPDSGTVYDMYRDVCDDMDYIIMTCPYHLLHDFGGGYFSDPDTVRAQRDEVMAILKAMGKLASERDGVVAYAAMTLDRGEITDLLVEGGAWSELMAPGFSSGGYLLLVGETEILPADTVDVSAWTWTTQHIYPSDMLYANTGGNSWEPELRVGRVIGNTANELFTTLNTSLQLIYSGTGYTLGLDKCALYSGDGDGYSYFRTCVADLQDQADSYFDTVVRGRVDGSSLIDHFEANAPDSDYIVYRGHGSTRGWADVTSTSRLNEPDLGTGHPVVCGWTCQSGEYEGDRDDFTGLGEDFMRLGAAAYVGAVEVSPRGENNDGARSFQSEYIRDRENVGSALRKAKRDFRTDYTSSWSNYDNRRWVAEYNLYGDPKLGLDSVVSSAPPRAAPKQSAAPAITGDVTLDVTIPDFEYAVKEDGKLSVRFTDQGSYMIPGNPVVPYYRQVWPLADGLRILDVTLSGISDEETTSGIELELDEDAVNGVMEGPAVSLPEPDDQWWPEQFFEWSVGQDEGIDVLVLTIYPFRILPAQGEAICYHGYSFDVQTASDADVKLKLRRNAGVLLPDESTTIAVTLVNSGEAMDVTCDVSIRPFGHDAPTSGMPLRILRDLDSTGTLTLDLSTQGMEEGLYGVEVRIYDAQARLIAENETVMEVLGARLELIALQASPEQYNEGDQIALSMTVKNTGGATASGDAILIIRNPAGVEVQRFEEAITGLAPGATQNINVQWDTEGHDREYYIVSGYAEYSGRTTRAESVLLTLLQNAGFWHLY